MTEPVYCAPTHAAAVRMADSSCSVKPGITGAYEHPQGDTSLGERVEGRQAACRLGGTRLQAAGETAVEGRDRQEHGCCCRGLMPSAHRHRA